MPVFGYRGLSIEGRTVSGVIDADSPRTARGKLRASGIFPIDISAEAATGKRERSLRDLIPKIVRGISSGELALLTRQLATLLGASVPLEEALGALGEQAVRPHLRAMLSQVRERVREGSALADALAAHGEVFSDLYVSMVRAGESAGALEVVLERLADYGEKQSDLVSKIRGALTYPIIMMCVGTGIMAFLVSYVVPQVATIFQQTNQALPVVTQMLIAASDFLASYWILLLLTFGIFVGLIVFALSTPRGRLIYDSWVLKIPYIGPTTIKIIAARFARTLATLLILIVVGPIYGILST